MLKSGNISINVTSRIGEIDVAYFNASFPGNQNGNYTISKNIVNAEKYAENQAECDVDYAEFEKKAVELAKEIGRE